MTNTSEVDFGSLSKNRRCIRVRLGKTGGEVSSSALRFGLQLEQEGVASIPPEQTLENEYMCEIPLLKAGQTLQLEATLTLGEAEVFECAEFWVYLELGKVGIQTLSESILKPEIEIDFGKNRFFKSFLKNRHQFSFDRIIGKSLVF